MNLERGCVDKDVANAVISALQYYTLFCYPLKADEIFGNMQLACTFSSLLVTLEDMEETGQIRRYDGYYALGDNIKEMVWKRKNANDLASSKKGKAIAVGKFIYRFPFVRFVGISGSLSKGYADENSDFDFFIVTERDRLWISRTILHLFKKLTFIAKQQHKFCMNYFVDLSQLELEDKNRFTAIELASLIPVAGQEAYIALMTSNQWLDKFFPNGYVGFVDPEKVADKKGIVKRAAEGIAELLAPNRLNAFLMKLTDTKWRKKWAKKNYPMHDYDMAFKTTLNISKNHPANHQKKVLNALSKFDYKK